MFIKIGLVSAVSATLMIGLAVTDPAHAAATPACQHGTALLNNDAHAWSSLNTQAVRLDRNLTAVRNDIDTVIKINDDIGEVDHIAQKVHKTLSLIAPLFALAPALKSGLERTANAAETSHKSFLNPVHKVTNALVTGARLHEIEAAMDKQVLPKVKLLEKDAATAHLKAVTLAKDYIEACRIAATIQSAACISSGNKLIDATYKTFQAPVTTLNTAVIDTANIMAEVNKLMETDITPGLKPVIDIRPPVIDTAKALHEIEHLLHILEKDLKKHVHIHVGPVNLKFTVEHLLKEWKKELKKLEHLIHVDKLKRAMRKAVEKVMHKVIHDIEKTIHRLEHSVTVHGFNMGSIEAAFRKLEADLRFKGVPFNVQLWDNPIRGISADLPKLKACK